MNVVERLLSKRFKKISQFQHSEYFPQLVMILIIYTVFFSEEISNLEQ